MILVETTHFISYVDVHYINSIYQIHTHHVRETEKSSGI